MATPDEGAEGAGRVIPRRLPYFVLTTRPECGELEAEEETGLLGAVSV